MGNFIRSKKIHLFLSRKNVVCELINTFCPKSSIGVEIGVYQGWMSEAILKECNIGHMYLIDPYEGGYANFAESPDDTQKVMDKRYLEVKKKFARKKQITLIRKKSTDAHECVPGLLDFVYIDGNHELEFVLNDLKTWVPKMKSGALVMGDDWSGRFRSVVTAVIQYCETHDQFLPPYNEYGRFKFVHEHVAAPGKGRAVVNKSGNTWWTIKK